MNDLLADGVITENPCKKIATPPRGAEDPKAREKPQAH